MQPDTSTTHRRILQNAFCKAVQHLAELDQSIPYGAYPVILEVMTWIVKNENPELSAALTTNGLWDQFAALLAEYGLLRNFAEQFVTDDSYDPYGWNPLPMRVKYAPIARDSDPVNLHVLVVDDDEPTREAVSELLQMLVHQPTVAASAHAALGADANAPFQHAPHGRQPSRHVKYRFGTPSCIAELEHLGDFRVWRPHPGRRTS